MTNPKDVLKHHVTGAIERGDVPDEGALPLRTQVAFKRHMARLVEERELL